MAGNNGQGVSVTALKAGEGGPAPPNPTSKAPSAPRNPAEASGGKPQTIAEASKAASSGRSFEFVVPKAVIALSVKQDAAGPSKPYADLEFDLAQRAEAAVVRRGFSLRTLSIRWSGEPRIKVSARFAAGYTPKNSEIHNDKLNDLVTESWRAWTHDGPASQVVVPDLDFGYSKLRLDGAEWSPPVFSVLYDEPGLKITNSSKVDLVYEAKDIYSAWGGPYTLKPGKSDEFKIFDPMLFRRKVGDQFVQTYTLPVGSHCEFRSPPGGGSPNLFQVPASAAR